MASTIWSRSMGRVVRRVMAGPVSCRAIGVLERSSGPSWRSQASKALFVCMYV